jgi:arsenite-transporting ATPase
MSDAPVLHLFGGKGGAGKTTLAAAHALNLAGAAPKEKVLLLSATEAGSLSDVLKKKLGPKPTRLTEAPAAKGKAAAKEGAKEGGGLFAAEFDPVASYGPFASAWVPALEKAVSKGQHLSEADLRGVVGHALKGLEELAGLMHVLEQLESGAFDRVVLDTASSSHTVRLFDLAGRLRKAVGLLKPGKGAGKKDGKEPKESKESKEARDASEGLEELLGRLDRLGALLKDPARTAFHLVTLGEPVAESQTKAFFLALRERGVPVAQIVVNQVEAREGCPACQGRRGLQAPHVRKYQALDKGVPVHLLGRREEAPRGLEGLQALATEWAGHAETKGLEFAAAEGPPALVRAPSMPPIAAPPLPPTRLIFFVGQGGVGKSSCAAAAAVTLTEKEGPVLLISIDPLHSLSDVLQSRLTDTETQVKGTKGLYARELDHGKWFTELRRRLKEKAERAFDQAKGAEVPPDREVLRALLDSAPASMDELAGLSVLTDALVQERFKRIVVDMAPVADASVRVVEAAAAGAEWLTALHAVLHKHRAKGLADLADDVAAMLKHVQRFQTALATPSEARFVVVTRGEAVAAARTERLVDALRARNLPVERVLVNRVLPKNDCPRCEGRRKNELEVAKGLEKKLGLPITVAPGLGRHPAGLRELKAFRTAWYALSAPAAKSSKAA